MTVQVEAPSRRAIGRVVTGASFGIAAVGALCAVLTAALPAPVIPAGVIHLPWWVIAILYAFVLCIDIIVMVRRQAQSLLLTEVPLVLGLMFASPIELFIGRLIGGLFAQLVYRKQYREPLKLAFNLSWVLEVFIAAALFRLVMNGNAVGDWRSWVAAYAGCMFVAVLGAFVVSVVISYVEGTQAQWPFKHLLAQATTQALIMTTLAVVCAQALFGNKWTAVPLVGLGAVVWIAYRAYGVLHERHMSLERLYRFSQVVSNTPEVTEVLQRILEQAKEVLQADFARITILPSDTIDGLDIALPSSGILAREQSVDMQRFGWVFEHVIRGAEPLLIARGTRDSRDRAVLDAVGVSDAIFVPLHGDGGITGWLCVGNRVAYARGFGVDDMRVLETVANHAAVALRNGRLIDQLRHESLHDALTGLPNRAYLQRALDSALVEHKSAGVPLAVMIIDLDRFKEVNDTLGHQHGDALLQEVARRMSAVAGERALIARLGGDEFAVLLQPCADAERATHLARSLILALQEPVMLDDVEVEISGSIGIAMAPRDATDRVRLLKRADLAMYVAKDDGRGVCLFEPEMDKTNPQRLALVGELRHAIAMEQLEVVFQPKADLATGRVVGSEALCRWFHPQHGWIPPEEFIPLAERSGLIRPLTNLVLRTAIAACAGWQTYAPGVGVAVNLSARSVVDDDIVHDVEQYLSRYDVPAALLTLELTEGTIMADPVRTIAVLNALADAGVRVSIDDFGTGYSSLSYLRRLPVHEVKIDKSFVQGIASMEGDDSAIVRSIVDLAHNLSLEVVAEGVESSDTWQVLASMACSQAQGYFISRPLAAAEFATWLQQRAASAVDLPVPTQPGPTRHLHAL